MIKFRFYKRRINSREIKFRAWDRRNQRWSFDRLYVDDEGNLYEIEERSKSYETYMYKENVNDCYDVTWFTGLYDKNRKEIYEGDIVESQHLEKLIKGEVVWNELNGRYTVRWREGYSDYALKPYVEESPPWIVIGNVYENLDLIESHF